MICTWWFCPCCIIWNELWDISIWIFWGSLTCGYFCCVFDYFLIFFYVGGVAYWLRVHCAENILIIVCRTCIGSRYITTVINRHNHPQIRCLETQPILTWLTQKVDCTVGKSNSCGKASITDLTLLNTDYLIKSISYNFVIVTGITLMWGWDIAGYGYWGFILCSEGLLD